MRTGEGRCVGAGRDPGAVLVTGGAGHVGSHVVPALREAGYRVVVLDNLSTGRRAAVPDGVAFVEGDAGDPETAAAAIAGHGVASVVHLAAIHVAAVRSLENGAPDRVLNRGSGRGVSVCEALAAVRAEFGGAAQIGARGEDAEGAVMVSSP